MNPLTLKEKGTSPLRAVWLVILWGVICHAAFGQSFNASFTPDTNSATAKSFNLWYQPPSAADTNVWYWLGESASTNISFSAPASNPALLSVTANNSTNQSAYSETYLFDTNNFTVAKQLKLFPPRFLKVTRKP